MEGVQRGGSGENEKHQARSERGVGREGGRRTFQCNDAVVFAIPPLIKYAKPSELWNVWLKILNLSP